MFPSPDECQYYVSKLVNTMSVTNKTGLFYESFRSPSVSNTYFKMALHSSMISESKNEVNKILDGLVYKKGHIYTERER